MEQGQERAWGEMRSEGNRRSDQAGPYRPPWEPWVLPLRGLESLWRVKNCAKDSLLVPRMHLTLVRGFTYMISNDPTNLMCIFMYFYSNFKDEENATCSCSQCCKLKPRPVWLSVTQQEALPALLTGQCFVTWDRPRHCRMADMNLSPYLLHTCQQRPLSLWQLQMSYTSSTVPSRNTACSSWGHGHFATLLWDPVVSCWQKAGNWTVYKKDEWMSATL